MHYNYGKRIHIVFGGMFCLLYLYFEGFLNKTIITPLVLVEYELTKANKAYSAKLA